MKVLYRQGAKDAKFAKEPQGLFAFLGVLGPLGALAVKSSFALAHT